MAPSPVAAPNVVVVVLDCVRGSELADPAANPGELPFLASLRKGSVHAPRCAAVSHWTMPSHASLFTGLYPWTHGLYRGGRPSLDPELPLMARWLGRAGYRTASFSANGLVNPSFGWLDGFEYAGWGCSAYWRSSRSEEPPHSLGDGHPAPSLRHEAPNRFHRASYWGVVGLERFPRILDSMARWESRWRGNGAYHRPVLASWVDRAFPRWLSRVPRDQPIFSFVNLMDAHEPYLMDREDGFRPEELRAASRVRQDHHGWIEGRWRPDPREAALLHRLYRGSIRLLDARVRTLVEDLQAAGRWENTLFVLTSDHGQAFGENGEMFHMMGISDDLLRVPLWVRFPYGAHAGASVPGWTSLIDIAPTVAGATDASAPSFPEGRDLEGLLEKPRVDPVYALADGATFGDAEEHVGRERARRFDFWAFAAYAGRWKAVLSIPDGRARLYDTEADPKAEHPLDPLSTPEGPAMIEGMRQAAARLGQSKRSSEPAEGRHLRAWGYSD